MSSNAYVVVCALAVVVLAGLIAMTSGVVVVEGGVWSKSREVVCSPWVRELDPATLC
jgi:hypothetical protein